MLDAYTYASQVTTHLNNKPQVASRPKMPELTPIDRFDELTAIIRFLLYLKRHPNAGITEIINGTPAGQRAIYSAKDYAQENQLIDITLKTTIPYGPQYSLSEKGKKITAYLEEIQKILNAPPLA
jgi:hypothetical protein